MVNLKEVILKQRDLKKARNYEYQPGEIEQIANAKFDRALRMNQLSDFPNVPYFLEVKRSQISDLKGCIDRNEAEDGNVLTQDNEQRLRNRIATLEGQLVKIEDHLKRDIRLAKFVSTDNKESVTVENIEEKENEKMFHQWLENQANVQDDEQAKKLLMERSS